MSGVLSALAATWALALSASGSVSVWTAAGLFIGAILLQVGRTLFLFVWPASRVASPNKSWANEPWDFIIVGGGSAGSVLAARLATGADRFRVLLIEAGAEDAGASDARWPARLLSSLFFKLPIAALGFQMTPHHWGYETEDEPELSMKGRHWAPCEGERGRPLIQCRGRVLGGSSALNLANYIRGHPAEYDAWAREGGAKGWAWSDLLPHFLALEAGQCPAPLPRGGGADRPAEPRAAEEAAKAGPAFLLGPIRGPHEISQRFAAAARKWLGGASAHGSGHGRAHLVDAPTEGAGLHWQSVSNGLRSNNAHTLRGPAARAAIAAGRLRVVTDLLVTRVTLEDGVPGPRATGVCVRNFPGGGEDVPLRASREVILCAGAINTPQLLMLSGIGAADELRGVGLTPRCDLPAVGKQLRDTAAVGMVSGTRLRTLDQQLRTPWPYLRYLLHRSGPLASNTLEASAFVSAERLRRHHSEGGGASSAPAAAPVSTPATAEGEPSEGWAKLGRLVGTYANALTRGTSATGAAGRHDKAERYEAAQTLIRNHAAIVKDATDAAPKTQRDLPRVPVRHSARVDGLLREVTRRLLGSVPGAEELAAQSEPAKGSPEAQEQAEAWAEVSAYLAARLCAGRDMGGGAAAATRAVLCELRNACDLASAPLGVWVSIREALDRSAAAAATSDLCVTSAEGAAAAHSHAARHEAVRALAKNHLGVLRDMTSLAPVTQLDLRRVPPAHAAHADQMMRELARRLLGSAPGAKVLAADAAPPSGE